MVHFARWKRQRSTPPAFWKIRSAKWFILMTVCVAIFTDLFLYGIIVPVIPFALSQRAGVDDQHVQHWVSVLLAVYGAALLAGSPLCGWLADKSPNRRLPLLVGLFALAGATVMLCVGSSIGTLVAGRLLQGLSAAVVWTVGLALLADTVGQQGIGQVMGYVSLSIGLGYLIAPLLGGVVYQKAGYYSVYYMAFALIVVDIFFRLFLVEKKVAKKWNKDSDAGLEPSPSPASSQPSETSAVKLPPSHEKSNGQPRTPDSERSCLPNHRSSLPPILTLLASRRLLTALWGCMVQSSILTAFDSVLPLRVSALFGWSSTGAGLLFLALVVPSFIAPVAGTIADKYGPRWLASTGFVLACPFLVLLRLVDHDSLNQKVLLGALLVFIGGSLTLVMTPLMAEITYVVEAKEKSNPGAYGEKGAYAQAYGLFNTAFAGGTLIGPIWGGFVVARAGWDTMAWSLGLLSALSAIPTMIWTGGLITNRHTDQARWNHKEKCDEATRV